MSNPSKHLTRCLSQVKDDLIYNKIPPDNKTSFKFVFKYRKSIPCIYYILTLLNYRYLFLERAPVARAGDDITIQLPDNSVVLDGYKSSDDYGIVKFNWIMQNSCPPFWVSKL